MVLKGLQVWIQEAELNSNIHQVSFTQCCQPLLHWRWRSSSHNLHYAEIHRKLQIKCPKNNLAQQVGETYYQLSLLASVTSNQYLLPPPPLQYSGPV